MESHPVTEPAPKSGRKTQVTRRLWTHREEEALLTCLQEIIREGLKVENGFRSGYLRVLAEKMEKHCPGCELQAEPNISSKIHVWKRHYHTLQSMLNTSGIGWNDSQNMVIVEDEDVWDAYVKKDPTARGMRYKPWPFYAAWSDIFGRDRATGSSAESIKEAGMQINDLNISHSSPHSEMGASSNQPYTSDTDPEIQSKNGLDIGESSQTISAKRMRRTQQSDETLLGMMGDFAQHTKTRLDSIAEKDDTEFDIRRSQRLVFTIIDDMDFVSIDDKVWVARKIGKDLDDLNIFMGMTAEGQAAMVKSLLNGPRD